MTAYRWNGNCPLCKQLITDENRSKNDHRCKSCNNKRVGKYNKTHKHIHNKNERKYNATDKGRLNSAKHSSKRKRNLGFKPLNKYFSNSHAHHIDREYVIYIPKELHMSVSHNIFTGKNMDIINDKVYEWFISKYLGE